MDNHSQTTANQFSARRKLIRGSFSVPAVLAVHNGSALAASSNQLRCAINLTTGTKGTAPGLLASGTDAWRRVNLYEDSGSPKKQWVKVSDLKAIADATSPTLGFVAPSGTGSVATGWVEYTTGGAYTYGTPTGTTSVLTSLVAVLFDSLGTPPAVIRVCGFVQKDVTTPGTNKGAITTSCWSSIKP